MEISRTQAIGIKMLIMMPQIAHRLSSTPVTCFMMLCQALEMKDIKESENENYVEAIIKSKQHLAVGPKALRVIKE